MARRHVVLGFDGSPKARAASDAAIAWAKRHEDTDILVVCAHDRPPDFSASPFLLGQVDESRWHKEWEQQTEDDLRHEATRIRLAGVDAAVTCSLQDTVGLLEHVADEVGAECIVVPDDGGGLLHDLIIGSTARRLKRTSKVPVVVVGEGAAQDS
jgi:nucleotide-binding universal stress UspA family protein